MRILIATTANAGHFGPMIPFAQALIRAGHEVLVAAPASFAAAVERAGFRHWPCADLDPAELAEIHRRMFAEPPERRNEAFVSLGVGPAVRSMLPGLLGAIDDWRPDAILREVGELGSAIAGELRGVRLAQMLIGLDKFVGFTVPLAARALADYRESLGLPPDPDGSYLDSQPSLSLLPQSFEEPGGPAVHRFRTPDEAPATPGWEGDEPLVYATFGTVAGGVPFAAATFRTVVEAVAELPVRLLVTLGDGGDPDSWTVPANVRVRTWVPQRDALAGAAAMVCHGGTGTVLGGLVAGVPLVVVPQFADQPDNAARVAAIGAGLAIGSGEESPATADEVRAAVTRVLGEPSFTTAAGSLAAEIAALPEVDEAVGLITGS